jgi:hypothetical protein
MHYVAMTPHTGVRLAEAGSGLIFAGIWLAAVQIPKPRFAAALTITALLISNVFLQAMIETSKLASTGRLTK